MFRLVQDEKVTMRAAAQVLYRQLYVEARKGEPAAVREILKLIANHESARAKAFGRGPVCLDPIEARPKVSASPALQLLGMAAKHGSKPKLHGWIVDLAMERGSPLAFRWERYIYPADAGEPEPYCLPCVCPRRKRSSEETRFKKGQSGNLLGRPPTPKLDYELPFEDFLYEQVEVSIQGEMCKISRAEALLHELNRRALSGDEDIARLLRASYAREVMERWRRKEHIVISSVIIRDGDDDNEKFGEYLQHLHIANRRTVWRTLLQPWAINAALQRIGERRLNREEQAVVVRSASTPRKVEWPDWWEVLP